MKRSTATVSRPTSRTEILMRRYRFAKSSFAIEGIHLSQEADQAFLKCIKDGCSESLFKEKLRSLYS